MTVCTKDYNGLGCSLHNVNIMYEPHSVYVGLFFQSQSNHTIMKSSQQSNEQKQTSQSFTNVLEDVNKKARSIFLS